MLTVLALVGALAVLFAAAVVATREGEVLRDAPRDAADLDLPRGPLQAEDVAAVRLGLAVRGYRMSEVDDLLDRVVSDLASRDARILELEGALVPVAAGPPTVASATDVPAATSVVRGSDAGPSYDALDDILGSGVDAPSDGPQEGLDAGGDVWVKTAGAAGAQQDAQGERRATNDDMAGAESDLMGQGQAERQAEAEQQAVAERLAVAAHERARQAALDLEEQATAVPPLAGRGVFLGVRVRGDEVVQRPGSDHAPAPDALSGFPAAGSHPVGPGSSAVPAGEPTMDGEPFAVAPARGQDDATPGGYDVDAAADRTPLSRLEAEPRAAGPSRVTGQPTDPRREHTQDPGPLPTGPQSTGPLPTDGLPTGPQSTDPQPADGQPADPHDAQPGT